MFENFPQENSGIAVGMNETIGYTTIAIITEVAAALLDTEYPRTTNYHVVIGIIFASLIVSAILLKESKPVAVTEEAARTKRSKEDVASATQTSLIWASGRESKIEVARSAFVYTSFINVSLITICFAGLMINFISGFVWSLMKKWMARGQADANGEMIWEKLDTKTIADIVLCYGVLKGVMQWIFGFAGDRYGRKWIISGGLLWCALGLVIMAGCGLNQSEPKAGFFIAALMLGSGTAMMYSNCLAAVCDHADPTWRSSALGAYRFWRDMGYAIGALVTGAVADWIGIPWSIGVTAILTALAGVLVALFYKEVDGDDMSCNASETVPNAQLSEKPVAVATAAPMMMMPMKPQGFQPYMHNPYMMQQPGYPMGGPMMMSGMA